ncbi:MAG TPA: HD-GYP domain-containing protein [Gemmatimonadales bacterium]
MTSVAPFLTSLGQALSALGLYAEGHPVVERSIRASYEQLLRCLETEPEIRFSFLDGDVVHGSLVLREFKGWEWAARFFTIGMERVEFVAPVAWDDYQAWVEQVYATVRGDHGQGAQMARLVPSGIRYGRITLAGESLDSLATQVVTTSVPFTLDEELEGIAWLHEEVSRTDALPSAETETIVRSLALTMHQEGQVVLPLLELKQFDQYTTTHSSNVSVLTMGLAEYLGYAPREVRLLGVAGLLHDIGKVRVSQEILVKPGKYTPEERAEMNRHPVEGARIILQRHRNMELAAVVAYEHHINLDGTGYPSLVYQRDCHLASRLVHVVDVYDALCARRPYRDAFSPDAALRIVEEQSGRWLDPAMVQAFSTMIRQARIRRMSVDRAAVDVPAEVATRAP